MGERKTTKQKQLKEFEAITSKERDSGRRRARQRIVLFYSLKIFDFSNFGKFDETFLEGK